MSNNNIKKNFFHNSQNLLGDVECPVSGLRKLAEAIVLQSIEDLWNNNRNERRGSFAFFLGNGFHICSELAGITVVGQRTLLSLIMEALKCSNVLADMPESLSGDGGHVLTCYR